jgi:hypothetical protein
MNCPECGKEHRVQKTAKVCYRAASFGYNHDILRGVPHNDATTKRYMNMKRYFEALK